VRLGGSPPPAKPAEPRRYKSPGEDLFSAIAAELAPLDFATKLAVSEALEAGEYLRAPSDVRRLFENVASQFIG
jgi:hypothetical protein